jgi:DNA-binding response OmpR family regulator
VIDSRTKRILVVDDEPDILEFLRDILEEEGYVVTTDKGEYAERLAGESHPDLILLDVLLSGRDGRQIVAFLKSQRATEHIPVIMLSAHPSAANTSRAAGADDFLAKPFEIDHLLVKITRHLTGNM